MQTYYAPLVMFGCCMLAVARLAGKVGGLTEVFFTGLGGALPAPKGRAAFFGVVAVMVAALPDAHSQIENNPTPDGIMTMTTDAQRKGWSTDALPLISAEEVAKIAPVIKKWTDFYEIDFAQARITHVDTTCFNCPTDYETSGLRYRGFHENDDVDYRIDGDYSPNKQLYVNFGISIGLHYENGNYYFYGWDTGQEIFLVDRKQKLQNFIMRTGSSSLAEAVFWKSNEVFVIVGYSRYSQPFCYFVVVFDISTQTTTSYEIMSKQETDNRYMYEVYFKEKGIINVR